MRLASLLAVSMLSLLALVTVIPVRVHTEPASEAPPEVRLSPRAQEEIRQVEARIDNIEAAALADLTAAPDPARRITLLGKLLLLIRIFPSIRTRRARFATCQKRVLAHRSAR